MTRNSASLDIKDTKGFTTQLSKYSEEPIIQAFTEEAKLVVAEEKAKASAEKTQKSCFRRFLGLCSSYLARNRVVNQRERDPEYFKKMAYFDTLFMLGMVMLDAHNNSNLFHTKVVALAGHHLMLSLKKQEPKLAESKGLARNQSNLVAAEEIMALAVLFSHGTRTTLIGSDSTPQKVYDWLLTGIHDRHRSFSSHIITYNEKQGRIKDAKTSLTHCFSPKNIADEQRALDVGAGIPSSMTGEVSKGDGMSGCYIMLYKEAVKEKSKKKGSAVKIYGTPGSCIMVHSAGTKNAAKESKAGAESETKKGKVTTDHKSKTTTAKPAVKKKEQTKGGIVIGLENLAMGASKNGHTHLGSTPAAMNLFETGPKIDVVAKLLDKPLKSKEDSLRVDLDELHKNGDLAKIMALPDMELRCYSVGMLLGLGRAVTLDEYQQIFNQYQKTVEMMVPHKSQAKYLTKKLDKAQQRINITQGKIGGIGKNVEDLGLNQIYVRKTNYSQHSQHPYQLTYKDINGVTATYWLTAEQFKKIRTETTDSKEIKSPGKKTAWEIDSRKAFELITELSKDRRYHLIMGIGCALDSYIAARKARGCTFHDLPGISLFSAGKRGKDKLSAADKLQEIITRITSEHSEIKGSSFDKDKPQLKFEEPVFTKDEVIALTEGAGLAKIFDDFIKLGGEMPQQFQQIENEIAMERAMPLDPKFVL